MWMNARRVFGNPLRFPAKSEDSKRFASVSDFSQIWVAATLNYVLGLQGLPITTYNLMESTKALLAIDLSADSPFPSSKLENLSNKKHLKTHLC